MQHSELKVHPAPDGLQTHAPPWQDCPVGQRFPQAPQLFGSLCELTSQPSATTPLQSRKPALQVAIVQVPLTQAAVPLAAVHLIPQPPQLFTSLPTLTSQPFAGLLSQSRKPVKQTTAHVLVVGSPQDTVAFGPAVQQTLPHGIEFGGHAVVHTPFWHV